VSELVRTSSGTISITSGALTQLVVRAAESVDGARVRRPRRGLRVELAPGHARVALELTARRGVVLPELARDVQERVAEALETMCEVAVDAVDVSVEEVVA
jgi:uncharacterized alkaline shock family protein YloU